MKFIISAHNLKIKKATIIFSASIDFNAPRDANRAGAGSGDANRAGAGEMIVGCIQI